MAQRWSAAYACLWGYQVGILANNGVLFNDSSLKATHFMQLCNQNGTPLLFLQNITGYMVGREYEMRGITKDGAKMIMALVGSRSAEIHRDLQRIVRRGKLRHGGRAFDPRFLFMWPQSQISVMGAEQAANVLTEVKLRQLERSGQQLSEQEAKIRDPVLEDYRDSRAPTTRPRRSGTTASSIPSIPAMPSALR